MFFLIISSSILIIVICPAFACRCCNFSKFIKHPSPLPLCSAPLPLFPPSPQSAVPSHAYETCRLSRHVQQQQKPQQILVTPPPPTLCAFPHCAGISPTPFDARERGGGAPSRYPVIIRTLLGFSTCFIARSLCKEWF